MIYISHLIEDRDMQDILENESMGIESIEFSIGYCLDDFVVHIEDYRRRLESMSYTSLSIHGPFLDLNPASNDSLIRKASRERFQQAYEAARVLGADKLIYHTCFVPQVNFLEGWVDLAVPFWEEFLADKDEQLKIHLENVFDPFYEPIKDVMNKVNHPAFSICLDLGHANHASHQSLTEWIRELGNDIGHIHIHDNNGITDQHLAVGGGTIPWDEVKKALKTYCPDVDYTIENSTPADVWKTLEFFKKP